MKFIETTILFILWSMILSCTPPPANRIDEVTPQRKGNFCIKDGFIYVDAIINDTDTINALFDTGAPCGLHLPKNDTIFSNRNVSVAFDNGLRYNTKTSRWWGKSYLIGLDNMNQYRYLSINYDSLRLQQLPDSSIIDHSGAKVFDYELNTGVLFIEVPIAYYRHGKEFKNKYKFLVDTGWTNGLAITDPPKEFDEFIHSLDYRYRYMNENDNKKDNLLFELDSIDFAGYKMDDIHGLYVYSRSLKDYHKNNAIGIIGLEILKEFNTIIDFKDQQLILKPTTNKEAFPLDYFDWTLGFNISMKDKSVHIIEKGSEAEKAGIQLGDTIYSINGIPSSQLDKAAMDSLVLLELGSQANVSVKRGNEKLEFIYNIK